MDQLLDSLDMCSNDSCAGRGRGFSLRPELDRSQALIHAILLYGRAPQFFSTDVPPHAFSCAAGPSCRERPETIPPTLP